MNKYAPLLALCATLLGSTSALAASSTDVSVTGTITPAACTPSLSGAGSFDFGKISAQDLNQNGLTRFISAKQRFTVSCSAPTRFAIDGVDNRGGTAITENSMHFGLGTNGAEKIGRYWLKLLTAGMNADGSGDVAGMYSVNRGAWTPLPGNSISLFHRASGSFLVGFALQGASEPSPISTLSADMQISMDIAKATDLTLTDDVNIDGSASIEVTYL